MNKRKIPTRRNKRQITARQKQVMDFISDYLYEQGSTPTIKEIQHEIGVKFHTSVRSHLLALQRQGFIILHRTYPVRIELTGEWIVDGNMQSIPILGNVPAGTPFDAVENYCGQTSVDIGQYKTADLYALKVCGDSMKKAGIYDEDLVIVKRQNHCDSVI